MLYNSGSERQRPHVFSHTWAIDPKDKHIHKTSSYINSYVAHVYNSRTTLWNSAEEEKEREPYRVNNIHAHNICEGRRNNDMY
jgi:hypothetical protein